MPMLHLLRHAKAKSDGAGEDRERGLSGRGVAAARRVGAALPAAIGALDLALCSSARRTRETMDLVLDGYAKRPRISVEDGLYLASATGLLRRLADLAEADENVLLIGHNPGMRDLALVLAAKESPGYARLAAGKFPTGARASLRIATPWSALGRSRHALVDYVAPRSPGADG